ncbi:MAG TPA: phage minor head protein [Vampirovibrionales bacterium]
MKTDPYNLPFVEAIAYFREKVQLPDATWQEILDNLNNWAFFVTGVTNAQLLQDFFEEVERFISTGQTFEEFSTNFEAIATRHGWAAPEGNGARAFTVADANLRTAYAAGRYEQMRDPYVMAQRPYWRYRHRDSPNARPHHKALDDKTFSAEEVVKNPALAVPSGFGCRCALFAVRSLPPGQTQPDPVPKIGGQVAVKVGNEVMPIADKGWNYMPGDKAPITKEMVARLRPELRKKLLNSSSAKRS